MADIRLELRLKNALLWHVIFDQHPTVAAFCRAYGFNQSVIGKLLTFKFPPYDTRRKDLPLTHVAERLCALSGHDPTELFPPRLYSGVVPSLLTAEVPADRFLPLSEAQRLLTAPTQDAAVMRHELQEALRAILHTLTSREEKVLIARFGLDGQGERTLEDVGQQFGVTRNRIRQVEAKALRKLRHPRNSRPLRVFLDDESQDCVAEEW